VKEDTPEQALAALDSSWDGLRAAQVAQRLERYGQNRLPERGHRSLARELLGQLTHFFALTLWACAALAFLGGMPQLGWAIAIVVVVNAAFSFAQEYRAERATRALAAMLPARALVVRDGERRTIPALELVPGDLLLLEEGARVSADATLLRTVGLRVDNSALTGESEPMSRSAEPIAVVAEAGVDDPRRVFAGSWVVSGSGTALVLATGSQTRLGQLSELTRTVQRRITPLRQSMNRAVRIIATVAVLAGVCFVAIALSLGMRPQESFLFSVGVIVALVPEGLLPTLTLALAMGATRMSRRGALVRHLEAVETLGSTTVICTDKTGTLTANQMTVVRALTATHSLRVTGSGFGSSGTILSDERPLSVAALSELEPLLMTAASCGDARLEQHGASWRCVGDPTEGALLAFARKGGVLREHTERSAPRIQAFPFESSRQRMTTVHVLASGQRLVLTKGAVEAVLPRCTTLRAGSEARSLDAIQRNELQRQLELLAGEGLRVLALARKHCPPGDELTPELAESELELLGFVGMHDPVRPEVPAAIARCQAAGIRVLMVTGDHPATARFIGQSVGLCGDVVLGRDLPQDDAALADVLSGSVAVLARVAPEQKLAIARALQQRGEVVAMTGDGVNDAPALRQADIGVAMGASGTDVAREAADLVLLDDNFSHIVEAIEEGRSAFANIRRFLTYHLTDNVAELAPFVAWALSGGSFPLVLSVLQILAIDIGTDLLPALALGAERPEPGIMSEPPRSRAAPLLGRAVLLRAFGFLGLVQAAAALLLVPAGAAWFASWQPGSALPHHAPALATLSTLVFAAIVSMQMVNAFTAARRKPPSSRKAAGTDYSSAPCSRSWSCSWHSSTFLRWRSYWGTSRCLPANGRSSP
jgi:magnesium-transporting ATPase (P-type)